MQTASHRVHERAPEDEAWGAEEAATAERRRQPKRERCSRHAPSACKPTCFLARVLCLSQWGWHPDLSPPWRTTAVRTPQGDPKAAARDADAAAADGATRIAPRGEDPPQDSTLTHKWHITHITISHICIYIENVDNIHNIYHLYHIYSICHIYITYITNITYITYIAYISYITFIYITDITYVTYITYFIDIYNI